ncbi:hypothetical protein Dimus_038849 [Dionaea muscipula]
MAASASLDPFPFPFPFPFPLYTLTHFPLLLCFFTSTMSIRAKSRGGKRNRRTFSELYREIEEKRRIDEHLRPISSTDQRADHQRADHRRVAHFSTVHHHPTTTCSVLLEAAPATARRHQQSRTTQSTAVTSPTFSICFVYSGAWYTVELVYFDCSALRRRTPLYPVSYISSLLLYCCSRALFSILLFAMFVLEPTTSSRVNVEGTLK